MGLSFLPIWPLVYGRTGLVSSCLRVPRFASMLTKWNLQRLLDYGMPAFGFLGTLHIVDVFFLRPIEEVHSWSIGRTVCQLMAFPNEKSVSPHPRWANFKVFGLCFMKYVWANALLCECNSHESTRKTLCLTRCEPDASPPPHIWASLKPFSFQWFAYSWVTSQVILCTLGFFVESVIRLIGYGSCLLSTDEGENRADLSCDTASRLLLSKAPCSTAQCGAATFASSGRGVRLLPVVHLSARVADPSAQLQGTWLSKTACRVSFSTSSRPRSRLAARARQTVIPTVSHLILLPLASACCSSAYARWITWVKSLFTRNVSSDQTGWLVLRD